MAIVEIINLTKSFKDIEVIHNTSFYLKREKYMVLLDQMGLEKLQLSK
ncbi:lantibiotic transport ATP-binding protein [Streptococcus pneumoniae]|nr:lantibiotic transport ATP-binding protein [Streptococcus pneumoniae]